MVNWILRWIISGIALAIVANIPGLGISYNHDPVVLIKVTLVIGLINSFIRPILGFLTAPLNCMTFGLFGLILNAFLFLAVHFIVEDFTVSLPWGALLGPILMGIVSGILNHFLIDEKKKDN
jgi:putative membrane protein